MTYGVEITVGGKRVLRVVLVRIDLLGLAPHDVRQALVPQRGQLQFLLQVRNLLFHLSVRSQQRIERFFLL